LDEYLREFRKRLDGHKGSLVKVASVRSPHAKEYMPKLAKEGGIESVAWGWYYVPGRREPEAPLDFLAADGNFKVLTGQTAASVWNGDFIHREAVTLTVDDPSYGRALQSFGKKKGWSFAVDYNPKARKIRTKKIGKLLVQAPEATVVDCFKRWAFVDAVATLNPRMHLDKLARESYWARIPKTDVRIGQALTYVSHRLFGAEADAQISDDFVRRGLDEAIEKVKEFE
jgi:hypothetical protein